MAVWAQTSEGWLRKILSSPILHNYDHDMTECQYVPPPKHCITFWRGAHQSFDGQDIWKFLLVWVCTYVAIFHTNTSSKNIVNSGLRSIILCVWCLCMCVLWQRGVCNIGGTFQTLAEFPQSNDSNLHTLFKSNATCILASKVPTRSCLLLSRRMSRTC
jgi:hypothetical protein